MEFYASCPEGFESALADELKRLGLSHVRRLKGRATFEGELEEGYRACLWSRLASRVFVVLGRFEAQDADELYDSVYDIAWETIIRPGATIAITARGVTEQLRNTRFSALRAKDALCDRLAETTGRRADVDAADPDVHLLLSLRQRRASISLDLSGDPLFKRLPPAATRAGEGAHVLRPDYAALVLAQVGWTALCERELTAELLKRISNNRAVIVIEHDMDFVAQIAHKVTVMHQGKILAEGTMEAVQADPKVIDVYLGH